MGIFREWTEVRLNRKDAARVMAILENLDIRVSEPEIDYYSRGIIFQVRAPQKGVRLLIHSLGIGANDDDEEEEEEEEE